MAKSKTSPGAGRQVSAVIMLQCKSIHLRCNIPHGIPAPEHFDIVSRRAQTLAVTRLLSPPVPFRSQVAAALSEEQRAQGCVLVQAKVCPALALARAHAS